jgi:hypothetical protein
MTAMTPVHLACPVGLMSLTRRREKRSTSGRIADAAGRSRPAEHQSMQAVRAPSCGRPRRFEVT